MKVHELIEFLSTFPAQMEVVLETPADTLTAICEVNSETNDVCWGVEENGNGEEIIEQVLVLKPCSCEGVELPVIAEEQNPN